MILSWFSRQTFWWIIKMDCCLWALSGPEGVRAQFQKCVYNSTFLILSWFLCQTFGGVFKFDCCLWAKSTIAKMCEHSNILDFILIFVPNSWGSYRVRLLFLGPEGGGIAQILKCLYTSTFFILSWFCANNLGECSSWIVVCEPCGGEGTIFKMYVQFNIPDFILIFVPNIWGSYQIGLLSLGPVKPRGEMAQFLKCVLNSKFLILSWFFLPNFEGV